MPTPVRASELVTDNRRPEAACKRTETDVPDIRRQERGLPPGARQPPAEVSDGILSHPQDHSFPSDERESHEKERKRVRTEDPHRVDPRKASPESLDRSGYRTSDLTGAEETVIRRELRQTNL